MKETTIAYIAVGIAGILMAGVDWMQRLASAYTFTPGPMDAIELLLIAAWVFGLHFLLKGKTS